MFHTVFQKNSNHTFYSQLTFSQKSCRLWDSAEKCGRPIQVTDVNKTWRKHFTCWRHKATNTHSECVTVVAFPRLTMGWTVRGSNSGGGEIFRIHPDRHWGPTSLLYNTYRVFPGGKAAGAWHWPPTPPSVEVKERVEIYLFSPFGPSWPLLGWNLPLLYCSCFSKTKMVTRTHVNITLYVQCLSCLLQKSNPYIWLGIITVT
jgi:hypothetical protein